MASVIPIRFRTGDRSRQDAIVLALIENGLQVRPGVVEGVEELCLEHGEPSGHVIRCSVTRALDRAVPGWERDVSIDWPE